MGLTYYNVSLSEYIFQRRWILPQHQWSTTLGGDTKTSTPFPLHWQLSHAWAANLMNSLEHLCRLLGVHKLLHLAVAGAEASSKDKYHLLNIWATSLGGSFSSLFPDLTKDAIDELGLNKICGQVVEHLSKVSYRSSVRLCMHGRTAVTPQGSVFRCTQVPWLSTGYRETSLEQRQGGIWWWNSWGYSLWWYIGLDKFSIQIHCFSSYFAEKKNPNCRLASLGGKWTDLLTWVRLQ
jgi:hypothetical protein